MYFEIKEDGEVVKSIMTNEKIKGTLEFTKTDFSTSEPLPNTLIEIYKENDELIFTGRTNEKGKIIIEELEYGKYYIREKEAPEGYVLREDKMYFEIKEDGEVIKSTMTNDLIVIAPNTLMNDTKIVAIIGITLIIIGGGLIIYDKTKKRK